MRWRVSPRRCCLVPSMVPPILALQRNLLDDRLVTGLPSQCSQLAGRQVSSRPRGMPRGVGTMADTQTVETKPDKQPKSVRVVLLALMITMMLAMLDNMIVGT